VDHPFESAIAAELCAECSSLIDGAQRYAKQNPPTIHDYQQMLRMRQVEELLRALYTEGFIAGSMHLAIGQEAVAVGATGSLQPTDYLTATYRGHHHTLAKGVAPSRLVAEIMGREAGLSHGRGGSMHSFAADVNHVGTSGIVGGAAPLALGAALSAARLHPGRVALTVFGDGAMAQGSIHEAMNLAALMKLPVIFVCENNLYSELTPTEATTAVLPLAWRAIGHGIPALTVDGNRVDQIRGATLAAIERARAGQGPAFLEAMTYRLCGHYHGDPEVYRTKDDVEAAKASDPLALTAATLRDNGVDQATLDGVVSEVESEIIEVREHALASPLPDVSTLLHNVTKESR
jgi:pyruvate dehydrogenase E1 component alpha subunit